ncbi:LEAF RUST 10 DISEASE-RESISTANCE LOCUS RECEPTOR-LIKE PROTEIN KINASE-like 1.2 isoform X2 [Hevea brasiliensis]|uniref:LEAF RUST 10 DISEASE-RESISTANCE LOCUS RECEPTOR-LIKE PROTEIN KINASE-like 1.2 isoform X2 n=1 Tax=Hevea brasiliensis TaxID=3981 RepID=UPI0025CEB170|nr:LEAF RUST 10 DISEASE-RESISTANCE LOCUS RECEPTOR-LIKE PROTEIN KINASE-like 1.2 isoform X2 [Hevea brasiliensis]
MGAPALLLPHVHSIIILFFLLVFVPISHCEDDEYYKQCFTPFQCGSLSNLSYPFLSDERPEFCGFQGFRLRCLEGPIPIITIKNQEFYVNFVNQSERVMTIARKDLSENVCPPDVAEIPNTTLKETLFSYVPELENVNLFYNCSNEVKMIPTPYKISCAVNDEQRDAFYATDELLRKWNQDPSDCNIRVEVPVPKVAVEQLSGGMEALRKVLREGFNVKYMFDTITVCHGCENSGGICGSNSSTSGFTCLCTDQSNSYTCPKAVGAAFVGGAIMCAIFYIYQRRHKRKTYAPSSFVSQSTTSYFSSNSDTEKGGLYFGVFLFTYAELEEATNNFDSAKELGDRRFGTVYYGKLRDGRAVAVKRLYENNYKRVDQFMNEVKILTRLRHQHLASLYGCTSRHSGELLLVSEYIPNGTVADHLHGQRAKPGALPWQTRMKISVETASALAYLHASDIIHCDVQTNNILLDNKFCVKVTNFGLSRLFPVDVTHASTAPLGTPGYVDPEYHECYQLTDKSDVYSFGVVLIELISSMPAVDFTRHPREINLSNMAINKIQSRALHELVDHNLGFELDYAIRRMVTAVAELAFQCLQAEKETRPSMENVLEALKEIQSKG